MPCPMLHFISIKILACEFVLPESGNNAQYYFTVGVEIDWRCLDHENFAENASNLIQKKCFSVDSFYTR